MVYTLEDRLIWDFWLAPRKKGEPYHLFFLQAPRNLPDPEMRHGMAEVGHAVSDDLVSWTDRPTALQPAPKPAWDDRAIWTGSIVHHNGTTYWFYTGRTWADQAQRIGLVTTADLALERWERHVGNPLFQADGYWYRQAETPEHSEACRDPWVTWNPEAGEWRMFFTADAGPAVIGDVDPDFAGVIGQARSADLLTWTAMPPVCEPGLLHQLEVPQHFQLGDWHYVLFCTVTSHPRPWRHPVNWGGTHYLRSQSFDGPYELVTAEPLVGDDRNSYYAGRVIEDTPDGPVFLAWRHWDDHGHFLGALSNPAPLTQTADGLLHVDQRHLWA